MPAVVVHNVPAFWLEELADHYEAESEYFEREAEPGLARLYESRSEEVRDLITNQGEHNA